MKRTVRFLFLFLGGLTLSLSGCEDHLPEDVNLGNTPGDIVQPYYAQRAKLLERLTELMELMETENPQEVIKDLPDEECEWLLREACRLRNLQNSRTKEPTPQEKPLVDNYRGLHSLVQILGGKLANVEHSQLVQELGHYGQPSMPKGSALSFDGITYPHVDGSTSTRPLARLMACRLLHSPAHWVLTPAYPTMVHNPLSFSYDTLEFRFANRDLEAVTEPREHFRLGRIVNDLIVRHHGTHRSYENLILKKSDFILTARLPSVDELKKAEGQKIQLDARPVALDAFVFLVNNLNPIDSLSSAQIRNIYAGHLKNWREVGGPSAPISAYQRGRNSGSQELMLSLVMKDTPMVSGGHEWKQRMIGSGMGGPFHRLINDENGLGFSVHYYEHFMASSPFTKVIAVDGVHPSRETIANRSYPYVTRVYAVIRQDLPSDHNARQLLDWLLTEEGQAVVAESGYVPIRDAVRPTE